MFCPCFFAQKGTHTHSERDFFAETVKNGKKLTEDHRNDYAFFGEEE
jgi:hypothetical protein